jgi:hypothetical protein
MWPVAKSGKRRRRRMRPPGLNDQRTPLSRARAACHAVARAGNKAALLSRLPVTHRRAPLSGNPETRSAEHTHPAGAYRSRPLARKAAICPRVT